ncbi:MAG: PrsW family glutamic-type intramembrane protease [Halobacteria archaeon]
MIEALAVAILIPFIMLVLLVERRETSILLSFFAWGSVAGFLATKINTHILRSYGLTVPELSVEFAPVTEEFVKALPLLIMFFLLPVFLKKKETILASIFSGIGFSVVENYSYILKNVHDSTSSLVALTVTRSISTTIMHGIATGLVGAAVYYVYSGTFEEFDYVQVIIIVGFSYAVMIHALFNLYVKHSRLGRLVMIMTALIMYLIAFIFFETYYPEIKESSPD